MGGTISGEHGVGIEKRAMMRELFEPQDLAAMDRVRRAFDPEGRLNPGKILPGDGEPAHPPAQLGGMSVRPDVEGAWI